MFHSTPVREISPSVQSSMFKTADEINNYVSVINEEIVEVDNCQEMTPTVKTGDLEERPKDINLEPNNDNNSGENTKDAFPENVSPEDVVSEISVNTQENTVLQFVESTADNIQDINTQSRLPTVSTLGLLNTGLFNDKVRLKKC